MEAEKSLQKLLEGNKRFVKDAMDGKLQNSARRISLVGGQMPYAIILGCADSRVVPELAFDAGLGELFTISCRQCSEQLKRCQYRICRSSPWRKTYYGIGSPKLWRCYSSYCQ